MASRLFNEEQTRTENASAVLMFLVKWFGDISCDYQLGELFTFSTFRGKKYCLYRTMING